VAGAQTNFTEQLIDAATEPGVPSTPRRLTGCATVKLFGPSRKAGSVAVVAQGVGPTGRSRHRLAGLVGRAVDGDPGLRSGAPRGTRTRSVAAGRGIASDRPGGQPVARRCRPSSPRG
jgi:hypothetical protein